MKSFYEDTVKYSDSDQKAKIKHYVQQVLWHLDWV